MELLKDIYFNTDKLIENTNVKVSYTGKLYQGNNDKVFLHYGYGKNWDNVGEVEMKKTDLGYQAELNLAGDDTINFCFKNENNEWDNNLGANYIFNIEKAIVEPPVADGYNASNVYFKKEIAVEPNTTADIVKDIVNPTGEELNNIVNPVAGTVTNVSAGNPKIQGNPITSLTLVDCKEQFGVWTKKVKTSVMNFFASVPTFISGNYKRFIENRKK